MNRRKALTLLGFGALAGCGGGGGPTLAASATATVTTTDPATGAAQQLSTANVAAAAPAATPSPSLATGSAGMNIACWGDSLTNLYAPHLQALFPQRQVFNGGVSGQSSAQINDRVQWDGSHRDWLSIFWYGHNDWTKSDALANLAASIATLKPGTPFIVLSMLNWATDLPGSSNYGAVMQVNAQLAHQYPDNFIDVRSMLVGLYKRGDAQDEQDDANDETPSSLRFDAIHLNDTGCDWVAAKVRDFISAKGW